MKADPTFWLLARAAGLTAYLLLAASVLAGLVLKSRPFRSLKPSTVTDTHRFLALLGLLALAGHGLALVADRTVLIPLAGLLVPGISPYRPIAVAVGVLTAELMVAVYASFALRRRIGTKNWRRLHWATYAIFAGATVHGVAAGTDSAQPWAHAIYVTTVGAVVFATAWRALAGRIPVPTPSTTRRHPA